MKQTFLATIFLIFSFDALAARFYVEPFTPVSVTVADGYLQIRLPYNIASDLCNNTSTVVIADSHKYFESYLSLATTAFVTGNKIRIAVSDPCLASPQWFQIANVMQLVK